MTISSPRRDFIWPLPVQHFKRRQRSLMRFRSKWKNWKRPILLLTQRLKHKSKNVNTALSAKLDIQKRVWTAANFAVLSKVDAQKEELLSVNSTLRAQIDSQKREWSFANSALTAVVEGHKREWRALSVWMSRWGFETPARFRTTTSILLPCLGQSSKCMPFCLKPFTDDFNKANSRYSHCFRLLECKLVSSVNQVNFAANTLFLIRADSHEIKKPV